jgi:hypothetical protein
MGYGPPSRKPDQSPEAQALRRAVAQQLEAKSVIQLVRDVGGSPTITAKKAKTAADSVAFQRAQEYRKSRTGG